MDDDVFISHSTALFSARRGSPSTHGRLPISRIALSKVCAFFFFDILNDEDVCACGRIPYLRLPVTFQTLCTYQIGATMLLTILGDYRSGKRKAKSSFVVIGQDHMEIMPTWYTINCPTASLNQLNLELPGQTMLF